jgi:quinoprotein glucose dehydrogenase
MMPISMKKTVAGTSTLAVLTCAGLFAAQAQAPQRNVWSGVYTADQAERGAEAYAQHCAACHGSSLGGIDVAPALVGATFFSNWNNTSAADLHERIKRTMPLQAPNSLGGRMVADIEAYILQANGMPAGDLPLPPNPALMGNVTITSQKPAEAEGDCTC